MSSTFGNQDMQNDKTNNHQEKHLNIDRKYNWMHLLFIVAAVFGTLWIFGLNVMHRSVVNDIWGKCIFIVLLVGLPLYVYCRASKTIGLIFCCFAIPLHWLIINLF